MRQWQGGVLGCLLLWSCSTLTPSVSQRIAPPAAPPKSTPTVYYGDEFAELDDAPTSGSRRPDTLTTLLLEQARAYYLQALQFLERNDTARAAAAFERALSLLYSLASSPMPQAEEFSELTQSVLEDYETYIHNADLLPPNSAFFRIRQQLLEAIDRVQTEQRSAPPAEITSPPRAGLPELPKTTIPLTLNEFVQRALDFLTQERGRRFVQRWLERSGRYFPMMYRIIREEQMPEELVYLSMIESGLNPFAVSRAGAVGLWQFIRSTGELYNLRVTPWIDERRDPEKSTRAALRHLRDLYTELGDWHLALAAYNCGIQAVRRALLQAQRSDSSAASPDSLRRLSFWDIRDYLPRETRNYVPLYIATTLIGLNPRAYGFEPDQLAYEPEYTYDVYELTEATNLSVLARCLNISVDSLRQLNPELLTLSTPPDVVPYRLKIPVGSRQQLAQCLSSLTPEEKQPWIVHTVGRRETLAQIAARYGVSIADIRRLNHIGRHLRAGMKLRIPVTPGLAAAPQLPPPPTVTDSAPLPNPSKPTLRYHRVQRGETLSDIAELYGVSVAQLKAWNKLRSNHLHPGQRLRIYLSAPSYVLHKVRPGETAHSIALRYGVSVEQLRRWNPKSFRGQHLLAGTTLRIYTGSASAASAESTQRTTRTYTVRAGDTLFSIARRFGVSVEELRQHNNLDSDHIWVGQRLHIPQ